MRFDIFNIVPKESKLNVLIYYNNLFFIIIDSNKYYNIYLLHYLASILLSIKTIN